ncbi:MAG: tandem-95 repeat protein [Chitinophagales bacterium]|nr:tandem-95 repeat protein [Chitinophagales bacterium]
MSKIYYLPRFIANGVLRNLNRVFLFSLFSLFIPLLSFAEGSAQLNPNASDLALIQVNSASFGPGIAYVGAPDIERLYFSIENPTSELVYFGFALPYTVNGVATTNAFGFQVRNSAGTVVHGPFTINNSNVNITGTEAARQTLSANGPNVLGAGGYSVTATSGPNFIYIFNPASFGAGDYYVEIGTVSGGVLNFSTADQYFRHFDITVTNNPATARINGRAYCKNWTIRTPCNGCPGGGTFDRSFTGKVYIYEDSGFVSSIDFASATFAGLGFELAFNSTGPNSGGTVADNRKSVEGLSTLPVYKVFLNDPDITLYPSGPVGSVLDGPRAVYNGACVSSNICFEYTVSEPGIIELLLDFDQASGAGLYDPGTADVLLVGEAIGSGPISGCVAWDGLDGLGSPVSDISGLTFELNYSQAPTHFMMYDVERVNPGFALIPERPFISGYVADFFHDSENIPDNPLVGTTNKLELNGCSPYCQEWNLNTGSPANGFGESNTINSWWYGNRISSVQVAASQPNCPPIANNDLVSTNEDTPVTVDVLNNDTDTESAIDTVFILSNPSNGSLGTPNPITGEIVYTPNPEFSGTDVFTYVICDAGVPEPVYCDTATVTISVNAINDAPVATDDNASTNEDTPVTVDVLNNDSDVDGNLVPSSVAEVTAPANGTTSVNPATGEITYTPDANFNGVDSFTYVVCDDGTPLPAMCDTATVVVTVVAVNDNVVAVDDAETTDEDTPVTVDVLNNDSDVDGNLVPSSVAEVTAPANGTTSVNPATGEITYTPDANFNGTDSFTYVVCDDGTPLPSTCDTATVVITINAINDAPVSLDDASSTNEDTPVTVDVLNNDSDVDGNLDPSSVAEVTAPANGTTSVNPATGEITYTPNANFNGVDSFTYVVCDDGTPLPAMCDTATVVVTVVAVNDNVVAVDDAATTDEDTPVTVDVLNNDSDVDGNLVPSSVAEVTAPTNGTTSVNPATGEITYTPDANFNGTDSFTYVVCDDGTPLPSTCDTATVVITINAINDAPVATDDNASTNEDTPVTVDVLNNDSDVDGNLVPSSVAEVTAPTNGTTSVNPATGEITYTPDANFNGVDSFTYVVCDDGTPLPAMCDTATVVVTVVAVNDNVVAVDDASSTNEDTPVTVDVLNNDSDVDGNLVPSSVAEVTAPTNGTTSVNPATGEITYTPDANFNGVDSFTYVVCDDGTPLPSTCDTATVVITINAINDAPVATDDNGSTNEDTPVTVDVLNNDSDVDGNLDPSSVAEVTAPANGTTSVNPATGEITYTPDANFNGVDSFTYVVCDDGTPLPAMCDTATVVVTVVAVNDNVVAVDDASSTNEDTPVTVDVLNNDSDVDGNLVPSSVAEVTAPTNGTTSVNPATGEITYTPNANFNGTDSFTYVVCDDGTPLPSTCDTATVVITINAINDAPVATDDNASTNEDTPVTVDVLNNDSDVDGNLVPSSVAEVTAPANGTTSVNPATGEITYTPDANFNGVDSFTYVVCDDGTPLPAMCDTATVVVTVVAVNDNVVAVDDAATTDEDTPVMVDVLNNDSDVDGNLDPSSVAEVTAPANGTTSVNSATGEITYSPNLGYLGLDSFTYVVCDDGTPLPSTCDTATVVVTIAPINDQPVALDDSASTNEDTPVTVDVLNNDSDVDGNLVPSSVAEVTAPTNGTTSVNPATGEITYTPDANFNGVDSFTYVVCDDGTPLPSTCDTATVVITINATNDNVLAVDDAATTDEDTPVIVDVLNNDSDVDGNLDPSSVAEVTAPVNGTTSVNPATGEITYTPDVNFNGTDSFTYVVCDDGTPLPSTCDTATVVVTIAPINDQPVALDDSASTNEDTPVTVDVLNNDSDVDGNLDPSSVAEVTAPTNGTTSVNPATGEITYTPDANFNGVDSFTYVVCDDGTPLPAMCDTATVVVTVVAVNDNVVAVDDAETTDEDTPVTVDVLNNDSDVDGNLVPSSVAEVTAPANGTTSVNPATGEITYTPNANFNGTDSFTYVVCDDGTPLPSTCDTATVVITINAINDALVALDDASSTNEDTPVTVDVLNNDSDVDGNLVPSSVAEVTAPTNGTTSVNPATGEITYTPDANFNGVDSFTYVVCDDGTPLPAMCDTATVVVTVVAVNDNVVAVDDAETTDEDTPVTVDVLNNDSDVDGNLVPSSVAEVTAPANGTTSVNPATGEITYTPDANFNGVDSFTYVVCDDGTPLPSTCDTATVVVTIAPINDQPVALDDSASTNEDTPVTVDVLNNDSDVDGNLDPSSVAEVTAPMNGTTSVNPATGEITYTPDANFNGVDSFTYVVCDDGTPLPAMCDTATVVVTVVAVNDNVVAVDDAATTDEDTPVTVDVLNNDSDVDGNLVPSSVAEVTAPTNGTTSVNPATGEITYTPNANFNGTDSFTYVVCDDGTPLPSTCDTATVVITINAINDALVALDDASSTNEDTPVTVDVLNNDSDVDGNLDPSSVAEVTAPTNGTTSVNPATGEITYTPDANFNGVDSFTYVVCDDGTPLPAMCDTATVVVTVVAVNDNVVAVDDAETTDEDTPVTVDVLNNDSDVDGNLVPSSVAEVTAPANGTTSVNPATGEITYTPDANFNGVDSFTYVVCDDGTPLPSTCDTATVVVTIAPINDQPVALDDSASTNEDTPVTVDVLNNDSDVDGNLDPSSVAEVTAPTNGTTSVNPATGEITYTPDANFNGVDSFTYVVCDDGTPLPAMCDTATVVVTVVAVNDNVVAVDDAATTDEDTPVTVDVLNNDSDVDGNLVPSSVAEVTAPANGTTSVNPATGEITYTPDANFNGVDSFTYVVCDDGTPLPSTCDTATVVVTIAPINDQPVALDDSASTNEDTPVTVDVLNNDSDVDGNLVPSSVAEVTAPANGTTSVNPATGEITYTPNANFNGVDSFTYVVCDDGTPLPSTCDTATVLLTILPVNDPPIAIGDSETTLEDTPIDILVLINDSDLEGPLDTTTVNVLTGPMNGTVVLNSDGSITYTPNTNYFGNDSFIYEVCDLGSPILCDTAIVTISIEGVIDTSFVTIEEDSTVLLCTTNFINVGGPIDNIQICAAPNNGTIAPSFLPCLNYTPDNNYVGMDTICVISCFGAICDTSVFVIDITPVNDTIIANDDFANTLEDQSVVIDLTVNDLDPDGLVDTASIVITSNPINGGTLVVNADGTVVYTPAPDFVGLDQFTYSVCDFGVPVLCDEALVTITVLSQPDTSIYTVPEDSLVIICTNDLTNFADPIDNIQICANPTNGTLTPSFVPCVSYMPNPNELGPDSFCVISCANGFCDTSYIIINVIPKNDGPTAIDENVSTTEDTPIDILILANDFDSDGLIDSTSVTIVSGPSNGSLVIDPLTGLVTYTPNANFVGTDSFIYSVCDDGTPVLCDEALVTITILPETDTIYVSVPEDGEIDICTDVNLNFANPITGISLCDLPENGDVAPSFIPCVTYTPGADFSGFDTLCVITCAGLICDTSIVIIEVVPVPDEPIVAVEDTVILEIAEIASFNVFDNDSLNDQAIETVVNILLAPINGSVELGSNGVALYTPFTDAAQADSFLYTVCQYLVDGEELCDTAWVYIFVGGDIIIPEGFTPNGDGLNDAFIIPNLQVVYPGASLKIFNRWGDEVYNSRGAYLSDWKGDNFNGNQLPDGTYFYILELNNDAKESIASYVVIYR